jgi:hypothetical protein
MATIVLKPQPLELALFEGQYGDLEQDLRAAGHDVRLEEPEEQRSAGGIPPEAWSVAVHILDSVDEEIIAGIVGFLLARLKGKALGTKRRRRAFIYGSRGETLREVDLPEE